MLSNDRLLASVLFRSMSAAPLADLDRGAFPLSSFCIEPVAFNSMHAAPPPLCTTQGSALSPGIGGAETPLPQPVAAAVAACAPQRRPQDVIAEAAAAMQRPMRLGRTPQWWAALRLPYTLSQRDTVTAVPCFCGGSAASCAASSGLLVCVQMLCQGRLFEHYCAERKELNGKLCRVILTKLETLFTDWRGWAVTFVLSSNHSNVRRWLARRPRRTSVTVRARPESPPPPPRLLPDRDSAHFLQQLRAYLKPANSGRNAFARAWKKQRQIQARTLSLLPILITLSESVFGSALEGNRMSAGQQTGCEQRSALCR